MLNVILQCNKKNIPSSPPRKNNLTGEDCSTMIKKGLKSFLFAKSTAAFVAMMAKLLPVRVKQLQVDPEIGTCSYYYQYELLYNGQ